MEPDLLANAVKKAGNVSALAAIAEVRPQAVSQWKKIPVARAMIIHKKLGIPLHELRPDVWPHAGEAVSTEVEPKVAA